MIFSKILQEFVGKLQTEQPTLLQETQQAATVRLETQPHPTINLLAPRCKHQTARRIMRLLLPLRQLTVLRPQQNVNLRAQ
jgi:hypothetical protein